MKKEEYKELLQLIMMEKLGQYTIDYIINELPSDIIICDFCFFSGKKGLFNYNKGILQHPITKQYYCPDCYKREHPFIRVVTK